MTARTRIAATLAPLFGLGLVAGCAAAQPVPAQVAASGAKPVAMLPDRLLTCSLGHATNVDFTKQQRTDEMTFDTHHALSLFLPGIPVRTAPPPDATEPAEPVDKRTRIVKDPSGLTRDTGPRFVRVVDLWPERVEMTRVIDADTSKLFIVSDVDEAARTANLFVTDARDLATFNPQKIYIGTCTFNITNR